MRIVVLIMLIFSATMLFSQTKQQKVTVDLNIISENILVTLKSNSDSLNNCRVQIVDYKQNVVKTVNLPKAAKQIESKIDTRELTLGNYTCIVYKGKNELFRKDFITDAIFMEPQGLPSRPYHDN